MGAATCRRGRKRGYEAECQQIIFRVMTAGATRRGYGVIKSAGLNTRIVSGKLPFIGSSCRPWDGFDADPYGKGTTPSLRATPPQRGIFGRTHRCVPTVRKDAEVGSACYEVIKFADCDARNGSGNLPPRLTAGSTRRNGPQTVFDTFPTEKHREWKRGYEANGQQNL